MKWIQDILYSCNENHYREQNVKKQHKIPILNVYTFLNYNKSLQPKAFITRYHYPFFPTKKS